MATSSKIKPSSQSPLYTLFPLFPLFPYTLYLLTLFTLCTLFPLSTFPQDSPKTDWGSFTAKGHLQYLENVWLVPDSKEWQTMGQMNNRLDFGWYKGGFSANLGGRNILNYGQMVYDYYPYLGDAAAIDYGLMNLTFDLANDSSYYFITNIDRANINFTHKNFEVIAGRQRINWGINMVWNPNDIFNTFNYFDFDYIERPGCDALSMQYYTGMTSSVQVAWKIDSDNKSTIAGMYRFNKWNYDFQVMTGVMPNDFVLGGGWSGQIKGAGFTGEFTYFQPVGELKKNPEQNASFVGSLGANYTFPNSFYLHGSVIYNSEGTTGNAYFGNVILGGRDISPKTLTPSRMEIFGEMAYQISPLIRGDISGIINPYDGSLFIGPSIDLSLTDNIGLLVLGQLFFGEPKTEYGNYGQILYGRLKWSF